MPTARTRASTPRIRSPRWPSDGPWVQRAGRFLLGVLLVPASVGLFRTLLRAMTSVPSPRTILSLDVGIFAFLTGMGAFSLAYVFLPRPTRAYILAHELTHAIFARLHGAKVRDIDIREDRGSVQISQSNILILLSPYFFPLYTSVVIAGVALVAALRPAADMRIIAMSLLGLSWGFHFCFTVNSLLQHQTDIERCGYVFSYALIVFLNLVVLSLGLVAATPLTARTFARLWRTDTVRAFGAFRDTLLLLHDHVWSWLT